MSEKGRTANRPDATAERDAAVTVSRFWTLANALTTLRLILAPLSAVAIAREEDLLASWIFAIAVASDLADGPLARRRGESSPFGSRLDHGTDALFVTLGLAALAIRGLAPAILPPMIVLAFAQYSLDSRGLSGNRLRASFLGRWNGILYFALLGTPIIRNALGLSVPGDLAVVILGWGLVVSTAISMMDRLLASRRQGVGAGS